MAPERSYSPPPSLLACQQCRALKVRCEREPENSTPCQRCKRLALGCTPQRATRRGRPSNTARPSAAPVAAGVNVAIRAVVGAAPGTQILAQPPLRPQQLPEGPSPQQQQMPLAPNAQAIGEGMRSLGHVERDSAGSSSRPFLADSLLSLAPTDGPASSQGDALYPQQYSPSTRRVGPATNQHPDQDMSEGGPPSAGPSHPPAPPLYSDTDAQMANPPVPSPRGDPSNIRMADHIDRPDKLDITDADFLDGRLFPPILPPVSVLHSGGGRGAGRAAPHEDPVHLGMLSSHEAKNLVNLFHEHLNPLIALLEPRLHSYGYLRETSTVLFSAVLTAASKFFKKGMYQDLLEHTNTIVSRAICNADESKALVQSLQIMVYWKAPEDTSAWRKIGWAIRMAYQFYWHIPRKRPLPEDPQLALETLDSERTWILLYVFDRAYARPFGLPTTIRPHEIGDVEGWARDHEAHYNQADLHLACVIELQRVRESWEFIMQQYQHNGAPALTPDHFMMIADMESRAMVWLNKWFGPSPPLGFVPEDELRVKWSLFELMLAIKRVSLSSSENVPRDLDQYLGLVEEVVAVIETLAARGYLALLQDLSSASTSSMCFYLRKLFPRFTLGQQACCVGLFERLLRCHERVSGGDASVATAFVARFIRRILAVLGDELERDPARTRQPTPSPRASGPLASSAAAQNVAIDTLAAQLGPFAENPPAFDLGPVDDQYWAQLLAATVVDSGNMSVLSGIVADSRMYLASS